MSPGIPLSVDRPRLKVSVGFENARNEELLRTVLSEYDVETIEAGRLPDGTDLCIVDTGAVSQLAESIRHWKAEQRPTFAPVLLLGTAETEELWATYGERMGQEIDAIQSIPVPKSALENRIKSLARQRESSLLAEEQRQSLERYEQAMDQATSGITIAEAADDQELIYVNDAFVELTGYDREEVLGRNCRFLQGEETDEETVRQIREAIENREQITVELRNYRKDGTEFWNRLEIAPVFDDDEVTHFLGVQEDVTERKARQQKLEEAVTELRQTRDIANVSGWQYDVEEQRTVWDEKLFELFDIDQTFDPNSDSLESLLTPESIKKLDQVMEEAILAQRRFDIEVAIGDEEEHNYWAQVIGEPAVEDGTVVTVRGVVRDITSRKRRERDLERYERIVETTGEAIYALNEDLQVTFLNGAGEELATAWDESPGHPVSEVFGAEHGDALAQAVSSLRHGNKDEILIESTIPDETGVEQEFQTRVSIDWGPKPGNINGFVCVSSDVTETRERARRLSVLDRVLRHNLRNRMNVVMGHTEVALEATDSEVVRESLESVSHAAEDLLSISDSAREFRSTLAPGGHESVEPRNIAEQVETVVSEYLAENPGVSIQQDIPESAWARSHELFTLAVEELINTAVTHGPNSSKIAVTVREFPETEEVVVEIFDDAMLVTPQEKYSLTEGTETPLQHSSDISLWLVKWMAVNSGGDLSVMENDSGGTTFEIRLPQGQEPADEGGGA